MDLTDLQITSRDNTIAYLTTRAEQAAKDAVEMARIVKEESSRLWAQQKAQAIIDKYKGVMG